MDIPGLGTIKVEHAGDLRELPVGAEGLFQSGREGVVRILTPRDGKVELIVYADKTLAVGTVSKLTWRRGTDLKATCGP